MALRSWDSLRAGASVTTEDSSFCPNPANCRMTPGTYVIENDFSDVSAPVRVHRVLAAPTKDDVLREFAASSGTKFRLCLDTKGRYVHDCSSSNAKTPYFAYVTVSELSSKDAG